MQSSLQINVNAAIINLKKLQDTYFNYSYAYNDYDAFLKFVSTIMILVHVD